MASLTTEWRNCKNPACCKLMRITAATDAQKFCSRSCTRFYQKLHREVGESDLLKYINLSRSKPWLVPENILTRVTLRPGSSVG